MSAAGKPRAVQGQIGGEGRLGPLSAQDALAFSPNPRVGRIELPSDRRKE